MSVSGLTLTGNAAGNYQLASTSINANIGKITRASLTITANNAGKIVGAENPAFSATYCGLAAGDSSASLAGMLAFSTPATTMSSAGTYAIRPSGYGQTSGNYTITYVDGVLTVTQLSDAYVGAVHTAIDTIGAPGGVFGGGGFGGGNGGPASGPPPGGTGGAGAGSQGGTTGGSETPVITQVPGLPLTLTGPGINTGGHPVITAAEQE